MTRPGEESRDGRVGAEGAGINIRAIFYLLFES